MKRALLILGCTFWLFCCADKLPEREELFTRTVNGTYRIHATTEAVVAGTGNVSLVIYQPYPESNRYQDVTWMKAVPSNLISTYVETKHPFVQFADRVLAPTTIDIDREYVVTLYKVKFDWSAVRVLYPYDTTAEEYVTYTRRYPYDIDDTNAYEAAYSWVRDTSALLREKSLDDLAYISNAYATVTTTFKGGDWPGGFTNLIARKQGDCGGFSTAFVSLLREGGIPARQMVCLRPDQGCHVWTEFYLQNYGWINADPSFDQGRATNFENFGNYQDNTIVMTYDVGLTVTNDIVGASHNVFVQSIYWGWWYWWEGQKGESARSTTLNMTWNSKVGMWLKDGGFLSADDLWERFNAYGYKPHVGFTFDCNYSPPASSQCDTRRVALASLDFLVFGE